MQQTSKYKLNKPGVDDPIAIAPLNENADKIEAAIQAEASARVAGDNALLGRIQAIEAKRIVYGSVNIPENTTVSVPLDFAPYAVLIHGIANGYGFAALALPEQPGRSVEIVGNGFKITAGTSYAFLSGIYRYLALG